MSSSRKLLILDIDETLLHSTKTPLNYSTDFKIKYYHVYLRPNLNSFLEYCLQNFEVAVWTASSREYADRIVDRIFPKSSDLAFIWSRERSTVRVDWQTGEYDVIKDLKKVKRQGYSLEKILFVDDRPKNLVRQYSNLIRVNPFLGDRDDVEFRLLMPYLSTFLEIDNVRPIEKRNWQNRRSTPLKV
ncbi:MAG: HAD family hydrolase [Cyanobacteriota bacterium]|nr:HAD family hydrolase [Cyanobacteriota bacterium]